MNKQHWNSINPNGEIEDDLLKDLLDKSYHLVLSGFSKKKQREILESGDVAFDFKKLETKEMQIEYRKLSEKDLNTFIEMRINQLREEGAKEDIDLKPALLDYYTRHMKDGTFVSWIAVDNGKIIGTSGMSFVEKPPYFGCPSGRIGLLSSMFTNPNYRRRGIAKELLNRVVDEARDYGCGTIQITASDMGVKLYTAYGFVHNGNFMQYKL